MGSGYFFLINLLKVSGSCLAILSNKSVRKLIGGILLATISYFCLQCFVLGNLVGPVVNTTIEGGLEEFFRQPTGCGEQNMIYLAPNVYVLEYLMNTGQLTGANEENAYRFIQSGTLRDLTL